MTPPVIAGLLAWAASLWFAFGMGQDSEIAAHAREQSTASIATAAAASAAAEAIKQIKVTNVTIQQRATSTVIREPVYRDCSHPPGMRDEINAALTGAVPAGGGVVPAASAPGR